MSIEDALRNQPSRTNLIRVLFENRFHGIRKRHKCDHANEIPFPPGFSLHFAARFRRSEVPCLLRKGHKAGTFVTAFDRGNKKQVSSLAFSILA